jgi:hypothetical protein
MVLTLLASVAGLGIGVGVPAFVKNRVAATTLRFVSITLTAPQWPAGASGLAADRSPQQRNGAADSYGFTLLASAVLSGLTPVDGQLHGEGLAQAVEGWAQTVLLLAQRGLRTCRTPVSPLPAPLSPCHASPPLQSWPRRCGSAATPSPR